MYFSSGHNLFVPKRGVLTLEEELILGEILHSICCFQFGRHMLLKPLVSKMRSCQGWQINALTRNIIKKSNYLKLNEYVLC